MMKLFTLALALQSRGKKLSRTPRFEIFGVKPLLFAKTTITRHPSGYSWIFLYKAIRIG